MIEGTLLGLLYVIFAGVGYFFLLLIGYGIYKCWQERNQENQLEYQEILSSDV
jgi:hypothetical protein